MYMNEYDYCTRIDNFLRLEWTPSLFDIFMGSYIYKKKDDFGPPSNL